MRWWSYGWIKKKKLFERQSKVRRVIVKIDVESKICFISLISFLSFIFPLFFFFSFNIYSSLFSSFVLWRRTMRNFNVQPSYDSKTNEQASLRCSWLQGRTLTSTWGKSRGWFKGVNFQRRRLIHDVVPVTSFRRCVSTNPPWTFQILTNFLIAVSVWM